MEHIVHPFSELFEQLGLDASHKGIEHFCIITGCHPKWSWSRRHSGAMPRPVF
ncbi:DUF2789 domain-containing protein [Oceanimonas sp. NS1]|nr:DUF2789 domain-containing protein [Oceanimonas sp. NS1]